MPCTATPLPLSDYLASRMISTPDLPVRLRRPAGRLHRHRHLGRRDGGRPAGSGSDRGHGRRDRRVGRRGTSGEDMGRVGYATGGGHVEPHRSAPADVDVAQLYDGFTIEAVWWLEALGILRHGRGRELRRGRHAHRRWTANCRSTPGAASCRAAGCTPPSVTPPKRCASCAAKPAIGRWPAPRWRSSTNVGGVTRPGAAPADAVGSEVTCSRSGHDTEGSDGRARRTGARARWRS